MEIEKTSKIINLMIDDYCVEDDTSTDMNSLENWEEKIKFMFDNFSYNKKLSINYSIVKDLFKSFNKIYKSGYFASFKPPIIQEYFCKQLNNLLIIDFILTFFRVDNNIINLKSINDQFINDFFIKLGDFYNFMDYLDVDEYFVNYLKYILVLYAFQLDRNIIEEKYYYFISILDNFFINDIMPQVFKAIHYKELHTLSKTINEYNEKFTKEIKEYNKNICYCGDEYEYLDDLFIMNKDCNSLPLSVTEKTTISKILNPEPPPPMNNVYADAIDDNNDNYYSGLLNRHQLWTPIIEKQVPVIEKVDTNYDKYRTLFILRNYKNIKDEYDNVMNEVNSLCASLYIKKYDKFEPNNKNIEIMKVKTILGCVLDYDSISDSNYNIIFGLACEYGHIEIVKALFEKKNGDIGEINFKKAQTSPNRDIPRYLEESKRQLQKINVLFIKNSNYYEPKIRFN